MNLFFKDREKGSYITWEQLVEEVISTSTYNPFCKNDDYYEVFKNIVMSLILERRIALIDADISDFELSKLDGWLIEDEKRPLEIERRIELRKGKEDLVHLIRNTSSNWEIAMFSSGTTGVPKKIAHRFESITRFVKIGKRSEKNIWGFAYSPTHMAGIQVFFQALLNGNSIVRLFGMKPALIRDEIRANGITHISATPTFYRLLLPCQETFESVERVTFGGERLNEQTMEELRKIFPRAQMTNVYASTEAGALFASNNDVFIVKPEFKDLVRIIDDELIIHNSLIGNIGEDLSEWYNTGDLVEIISTNPVSFRFLSRKSEIINVGGYKVNPFEVEEALLYFPGIKSARVFSKKNSVMGNIVCCEVVRENEEVSEPAIRLFLQSKLQEFKIPRVIQFVEELSLTRTGKLKRLKP